MTSLSAFASHFLSTGASTASIQPHRSTASRSSGVQPFGSPNGSARATDDDQEDEEGLRSISAARGQRHLPHLYSATHKPINGSLSSSSRILAQIGGVAGAGRGTKRGARSTMDLYDDIDEEDDADDEGRSVYPHQHRSIDMAGGQSSLLDEQRTPSASLVGRRDDHDPFLDDTDINRSDARNYPARISDGAPGHSQPKARGWLAHAMDASSIPSVSSIVPARRGKARRRELPDDIYRDPDESSDTEEDAIEHTSHKGLPPSDAVHDSSTIATSSDESDADHVPRPGRQGHSKRRASYGKRAAQTASSSLREPLLSSVGSDVLDQPPGAFNGPTSRLASADIYSYPHPPAQSGWTPWAPGNRVPLSQYKDKGALVSWLSLSAVTLIIAGWMAIGARSTGSAPSSPSTRPSPYFTLTRSIPVLFLLTFLSLLAAGANLLLLRNIKRIGGGHVIRYALLGVPIVLSLGWAWAFAASFIYDDERWSGGTWSTTGLRILSVLPLVLAIAFARNVWRKRDSLSRSLSVLELSATIVAKHPILLLLSLASLFAFIAMSAVFLTVFVRLFLRGHFGSQTGTSKAWKTDANARLMAWCTLAVWIWTWLVLRGIQRVTVAGVVSHWYFHRQDDGIVDAPVRRESSGKLFDAHDEEDEEEDDDALPGPAPGEWLGEEQISLSPPTHVDIVRASFIRATGPALGTICMSAMMLSIARVGIWMASSARWAPRKLSTSTRVPHLLQPLTVVVALLAGVSALLQGLSDYALVYVGVTGDGFQAAARRSARLTARQGLKSVMEGLVIDTLLDLTTLALCFLCGVAGFLISAHNLHVPADAPLVGLLCAALPYATLRLCADVLSNATDTLYLCFSIDEASGEQHCKEASDAFLSPEQELTF